MSLQGRKVKVNVPTFVGTSSVVQSKLARVVVDLTSRYLVLTEPSPTDPSAMLFAIEQDRSSVETVGEDAWEEDQCVNELRLFLDSKPDVDLVDVFFPYMDYVRDGRLVGEQHQAIVLYNAADAPGSPAVMLANFLHGYHRDLPYRIHLEPNDYLVGHRVGQPPCFTAGDVDVVKLFSLPQTVGNGRSLSTGTATWWDWKVNGRDVKLRNGQAIRTSIVDSLISLAQTNLLVYATKTPRKKCAPSNTSSLHGKGKRNVPRKSSSWNRRCRARGSIALPSSPGPQAQYFLQLVFRGHGSPKTQEYSSNNHIIYNL